MDHPFSNFIPYSQKYKKLLEIVFPDDTLAVLINADPDAMASALALKRLLWRKVKRTLIYHVNIITRPDNLAMARLLKIGQQPIRALNSGEVTKWAIVDSQPGHHDLFRKHTFDIIIDHHPVDKNSRALFMDIPEGYGANSTIMTEYLQAAHIKPSPQMATALFYGIKTDTADFVRSSSQKDIDAFQYLYAFSNMNMIKKIELTEITKKSLVDFRVAFENLMFIKDKTFIFMGQIQNSDILVILADFFLKMAESNWCIVAGLLERKLIVIFRYAGFRQDAGKLAYHLFGLLGNAGGHKQAARAEVVWDNVFPGIAGPLEIKKWMIHKLRVL